MCVEGCTNGCRLHECEGRDPHCERHWVHACAGEFASRRARPTRSTATLHAAHRQLTRAQGYSAMHGTVAAVWSPMVCQLGQFPAHTPRFARGLMFSSARSCSSRTRSRRTMNSCSMFDSPAAAAASAFAGLSVHPVSAAPTPAFARAVAASLQPAPTAASAAAAPPAFALAPTPAAMRQRATHHSPPLHSISGKQCPVKREPSSNGSPAASAAADAAAEPTEAILGRILDLEELDTNMYRGYSPEVPRWGRVYGGQTCSQALVASCRTVDAKFIVHSLHAYFLRPGDDDLPIVYYVERLRNGSTFASRRVTALQKGQAIFAMMVSFQVEENGVEHQRTMPDVPPPESIKSLMETYVRSPHPSIHPSAALQPSSCRASHPCRFRGLPSAELTPSPLFALLVLLLVFVSLLCHRRRRCETPAWRRVCVPVWSAACRCPSPSTCVVACPRASRSACRETNQSKGHG
jgi:hypothetical protein